MLYVDIDEFMVLDHNKLENNNRKTAGKIPKYLEIEQSTLK